MTAKTSLKARRPQWTIPRGKDGSRTHRNSPNVLVVDVGGTNVKILVSGKRMPRKISSGPTMTARAMVEAVQKLAADWSYIGPMMSSHWDIQAQYGPAGRLRNPKTWARDGSGLILKRPLAVR